MADEPTQTDEPSELSDQKTVRVKRRLRSDSETLRERSQKLQTKEIAQQEAGRSGLANFIYGFSLPARWLFRAIGRLDRFKFFHIIGLILLPRYIRNSWKELRQVTWPNFRTTTRLTYAVLVFSAIFGVAVFFIDLGLDKLFKEFILK